MPKYPKALPDQSHASSEYLMIQIQRLGIVSAQRQWFMTSVNIPDLRSAEKPDP